MTQKHAAWLTSLGGRRFDLSADRTLQARNTLSYPGNVTTATLRGAVKIAPDTATEEAEFVIGTPVFADGFTTWSFSLNVGSGANSTGGLPIDDDGDGVDVFVYDLLLTLSGGSTQRVAAGLFIVSGFVTEPA